MRKPAILIAGLMALATPFAFQMTASATASKSALDSRVELNAGKKKAKGAKSCGAFMYRKEGQCVDARAKK